MTITAKGNPEDEFMTRKYYAYSLPGRLPEELREEVRKEIRKMERIYRDR